MIFNVLFTAAIAATSALAQSFTINSPAALIECQPAALSWTGGKAPYILAVIPGGQPSAAALTTLADNTQSTSYTWNVNLAASTSVTIKLTDADGNIAYSSPVTIQKGASTACFNASATSAAGAAGVVGSSTGAASGSASSGVAAASSGVASRVSSASSAAASAVSAVSSSAAGVVSSAAGAASSASSAVRPSSTSAGASTPVSSAGAATSSRSAGDKLAAPGLLLAAVGGVLALF